MAEKLLDFIVTVCVTGKAQEVYSALSLEQSGEYDVGNLLCTCI